MNREEARLILDAHTLAAGGVGEVDPQLREAQALMERDEELRKWFEVRHASDERLAEALSAVEIPAHLRDRLLKLGADAPPTNVVKFPGRMGFLLALAAALVIGIFAAVRWFAPNTPTMPAWESDSLAMVKGLDSQKISLDHTGHDLAELKGFLAKASAPMPEGIPTNLAPHLPVGCKSFLAANVPSSVVCFEIAPGVLAHLVTVSAGPKVSGAQVGKPEFAQNGEWHTAVWSNGKQTYILGTRAQMSELKHLFS